MVVLSLPLRPQSALSVIVSGRVEAKELASLSVGRDNSLRRYPFKKPGYPHVAVLTQFAV